MAKGHRDNHAARLKRGDIAFAKKAERRTSPDRPRCRGCGTSVRPEKMTGDLCPVCLARLAARP